MNNQSPAHTVPPDFLAVFEKACKFSPYDYQNRLATSRAAEHPHWPLQNYGRVARLDVASPVCLGKMCVDSATACLLRAHVRPVGATQLTETCYG
jgi:hypothetical protein